MTKKYEPVTYAKRNAQVMHMKYVSAANMFGSRKFLLAKYILEFIKLCIANINARVVVANSVTRMTAQIQNRPTTHTLHSALKIVIIIGSEFDEAAINLTRNANEI